MKIEKHGIDWFEVSDMMMRIFVVPVLVFMLYCIGAIVFDYHIEMIYLKISTASFGMMVFWYVIMGLSI